jgi:hypothetical protein
LPPLSSTSRIRTSIYTGLFRSCTSCTTVVCTHPSRRAYSFTPSTFFIEFGVPLALNGLICGCIFKDSVAMMVGYSIVIAWYTLDHDQYLQLEHWQHHRFTSGRYSIYVKLFDRDGPDNLDKITPLIGELRKK